MFFELLMLLIKVAILVVMVMVVVVVEVDFADVVLRHRFLGSTSCTKCAFGIDRFRVCGLSLPPSLNG